MSSALPMARLRPWCAALRPAAPAITHHQWNAVTSAFARHFCSHQPCFNSTPVPPSPLLSALPSPNAPLSPRQSRSFSSTPRGSAKVSNPPAKPPLPQPRPLVSKKRQVQIGPLPKGEVDGETIESIFGPRISVSDGNNVLRILHHRRTSGSLADYGVDNLGHRYTAVNRELATRALDWLRGAFPVDEARAAEEWAEKEANRIAYELWLADPENESKYNDPARIWREQQKEAEEKNKQQQQQEPPGQTMGMLRVGPSEFERNIEEKRRQRLEEMARKAEEKELKEKEEQAKLESGEWVRTPGGTALMKPGQETYVDVFGREQISRRKEMRELYAKKAETPFKSSEEMLSARTMAQRLYPMSAFVVVVCLLGWGFAHYYIPPSPAYRLWPDLSPSTATIGAIVGANVAICLLWRVMPLWPFMSRYFMHVPGYPRAIQSVTNVFSHVQYEHLIANMMFLCLAGVACHDMVGRGVFLGTYLSAGALGTLTSLYWANLGRGNITAHSVGASAAIWGISALYCLLTDQERIKIPFVKDMDVAFWPKSLFAAFVVVEIINARKGKGPADHASHFGGMLTGMGVAGYLHYTGFHERRRVADGVQQRVQEQGVVDKKTIDAGAIVKQEVNDVKEAVKKVAK